MTYQTILLDIADGVGRITLNRPDRLNSFTAEMHAELRDAIEKVAKEGRALLLTGAGRGFCAGQDLSQRRQMGGEGEPPPDLGHTIETFYNPLVKRMRSLELPIVGAVNGVAAGAGMSLALACDITLAARSATFLQAFAKLGLVPDSGSTYFLPRLIGEARARALALLAEKITAEQAAAWGLIWKVVDDAADGRGDGARAPLRDPADQGARAHQAGARRLARQQPRRPARPRARPAARAGPHAGLSRGRGRVLRETRAEIRGTLRA